VREVRTLTEQSRHASAEQLAIRQREKDLQQQLTQLETQCQDARVEYRDCVNQAEQARRDVERMQLECAQVYAELPEPFRLQVSRTPPADWATTVYPTIDELTALRQDAAGVAAARQQLREAERQHQQWNLLKAQETDKQQALARLQTDLPKDRQAVRQEHVRLESEEAVLDKGLTARRKEADDAQKQLDRLIRDHEQLQQQLAEIDSKLKTEEASRRLWQQTVARTRKELSADWQLQADRFGLAQLNDWRQQLDDLIDQQTEERGRQLQHARASLEVLRQTRIELEGQEEQFPAEARQQPEQVQTQLEAAREEQRQCDEELGQARQRKVLLETQQQQRKQIQDELRETEQELAHYKTLAELLGRDRLQLYLVRQAERQVVDYANAVLDRLSGGQLYLQLCGVAGGEDNTAKALELAAVNRTTGEKPINVAFLSGSQKFRVAVSLALGLGQYASRQHRAIEAVIIDEGFGCLDRQGRQVMIQELQNLRGQLRCILLVSHQEEFAEAFADGYHFELTDGTTRVTRFQR
jgi:DNA repair exonuclease SbcCD ATPase subunit